MTDYKGSDHGSDSGGSGADSDEDSSSGAESVDEFKGQKKRKSRGEEAEGKKPAKPAKRGKKAAAADDDDDDTGKGKGKKPRKKRAKKDPNAPKRSLSAYFIFSQVGGPGSAALGPLTARGLTSKGSRAGVLGLQENRARLKGENPGASVTDMAKILGEAWKTVTPEEKKVRALRLNQAGGDEKEPDGFIWPVLGLRGEGRR
jgi:hypothetical protein